MRKIATLGLLVLLAVLAMPTASALENTTYYFDPPNPIASGCGDTVVRVMAHAPYDLNVAEFAINSSSCIDIVACDFNPAWTMAAWNGVTGYVPDCWGPGHDWFSTWAISDLSGPDVWICNITINCTDPSCSYCTSHLNFTCGLDCSLCMFIAGNASSGNLLLNATNGTFTCGEEPTEVDLNVTNIYFNPGDKRANETLRVYVNQSNDIAAVVHNNGPADVTGDFDVCFEVDGNQIDCVTVTGGLLAGDDIVVPATWTPPCGLYPVMLDYPLQSLPFTINVTADCNCGNCPNCPDGSCGKITETDEANNTLSMYVPAIQNNYIGGVVNNGYKSKHFDCDTLEDPLSDYWVVYRDLPGGGLTYNVTGAELILNPGATDTRVHTTTIPGDTVKKAMLFVYWRGDGYTYPSGLMANLSANMSSVCGTSPAVMPIEATYYDSKGFEKYLAPMGVYIYNVTDLVCTNSGNPVDYTVNVTNIDGSNTTKLMGEMLVVVYEGDGSSDLVDIWINEGTDYLMAADATHGSYAFHVSPAEATATIPFSGTDTIPSTITSANLTAVVGYGEKLGSNLLFNGNVIKKDAWMNQAYPSSHIDVEELDVTSDFIVGSTNSMGFMDNTSNGFYAYNTFLVVTKSGDAKIGIDQPKYVQPQDQFYVNITVDPMGQEISAVQYDLYYNTSVIWAEWANPGPFLSQDGADTDVVFKEIYNEWDVANHIGRITYAETTLAPLGSGVLPNVTEPGVLTHICFSAIGEPNTSSDLWFLDVKMSGPNKTEVLVNITNCSVLIYENKDPVANATSKYWVSNVASKFQCFAKLCCCNSHGGDDDWKGKNITYVRWDFGDGQYGTSEGLEDCQKPHMYTSWNWIGEDATGYYIPFIAQLTVRDDGCPPKSNTTAVQVTVYIAGDTNGDGIVDIYDAACVGKHWMQEADNNPPENCTRYWTEEQADEADLNNDNTVDIIDAMIVGTNWDHIAWYPYELE